MTDSGKLISVIGDEETCAGFLMGGIGEMNKDRQPNFKVVDRGTPVSVIEETFRAFIRRSDVAIILINQNIADKIRHEIDRNNGSRVSVLEIPSKDVPFDSKNDYTLKPTKGMYFGGNE